MDAFSEDVLNAIANDYEEITATLLEVRRWHPTSKIDEDDVIAALKQLIESGFANAFELSTKVAEVVEFESSRAKELYFFISPKGKQSLAG